MTKGQKGNDGRGRVRSEEDVTSSYGERAALLGVSWGSMIRSPFGHLDPQAAAHTSPVQIYKWSTDFLYPSVITGLEVLVVSCHVTTITRNRNWDAFEWSGMSDDCLSCFSIPGSEPGWSS